MKGFVLPDIAAVIQFYGSRSVSSGGVPYELNYSGILKKAYQGLDRCGGERLESNAGSECFT